MVQDFIAVLNRIPGKYEYQLPTTEQWEYAARAGTTADNLNDLRAMAWHYDNSDGKTHPVATMRANAWGLHDMHGNVKEWTSSLEWPLNPGAKDRIIRGGSYGDPLGECYSFKMAADDPDLETSYVGFRLVRKLKSTPPPEIRTDEYDHTSK
jgi:formylglycine-generating enzyme required for sulfatase activity